MRARQHHAGDHRTRLRVFRDGRFVEDGPAGPPSTAQPLLAPDSLAARVVGYGCLAVVVVPLLLVALVGGLVAVVSGLGEERRTATGVVLSVGPGTDLDGVRRDHCYEVGYAAGGRDLVHRTCEVLPGVSVHGPVDETTRAQSEQRFAAAHPVGSRVRLRHAAEPPYAAEGPVADHDVTLLHPSRTGVVAGALVAGCAVSLAVGVLWLGLRRRRPLAG